mgnify:CR=1 FL=1
MAAAGSKRAKRFDRPNDIVSLPAPLRNIIQDIEALCPLLEKHSFASLGGCCKSILRKLEESLRQSNASPTGDKSLSDAIFAFTATLTFLMLGGLDNKKLSATAVHVFTKLALCVRGLSEVQASVREQAAALESAFTHVIFFFVDTVVMSKVCNPLGAGSNVTSWHVYKVSSHLVAEQTSPVHIAARTLDWASDIWPSSVRGLPSNTGKVERRIQWPSVSDTDFLALRSKIALLQGTETLIMFPGQPFREDLLGVLADGALDQRILLYLLLTLSTGKGDSERLEPQPIHTGPDFNTIESDLTVLKVAETGVRRLKTALAGLEQGGPSKNSTFAKYFWTVRNSVTNKLLHFLFVGQHPDLVSKRGSPASRESAWSEGLTSVADATTAPSSNRQTSKRAGKTKSCDHQTLLRRTFQLGLISARMLLFMEYEFPVNDDGSPSRDTPSILRNLHRWVKAAVASGVSPGEVAPRPSLSGAAPPPDPSVLLLLLRAWMLSHFGQHPSRLHESCGPTIKQLETELFSLTWTLLLNWSTTHPTVKVRVGSLEALVDWCSTAREFVTSNAPEAKTIAVERQIIDTCTVVVQNVEHSDAQLVSKSLNVLTELIKFSKSKESPANSGTASVSPVLSSLLGLQTATETRLQFARQLKVAKIIVDVEGAMYLANQFGGCVTRCRCEGTLHDSINFLLWRNNMCANRSHNLVQVILDAIEPADTRSSATRLLGSFLCCLWSQEFSKKSNHGKGKRRGAHSIADDRAIGFRLAWCDVWVRVCCVTHVK